MKLPYQDIALLTRHSSKNRLCLPIWEYPAANAAGSPWIRGEPAALAAGCKLHLYPQFTDGPPIFGMGRPEKRAYFTSMDGGRSGTTSKPMPMSS